METLYNIHHDFAYTALVLNVFAGIWTLIGMKVDVVKRKKYFLYPIYIAWGALTIQVFLGVSLLLFTKHQAPSMHYFYGFISLMVMGGVFAYSKSFGKKKYLILGIVAIFLAALSVRTIMVVL
jgi:hypothetical protein